MRALSRLLLCFVLVSLVACGERSSTDDPASTSRRIARTTGSAVALSRDERIAVVTNRTANVVSIFTLDPGRGLEGMASTPVQISTGAGSEPWTAVIGPDDDSAYVVLRGSQEVVRISSLHDSPTLDDQRVRVGSEPMAMVITPNGTRLYVANWADGSISLIRTEEFKAYAPLDLNVALVETGALGGHVIERTGLAHPRALAITDNGNDDDDDETLFATEFFSQECCGTDDSERNREGLIYTLSSGQGNVTDVIRLSPVMETGFVDGEGRMTSCFPNQLYAAAIDNDRLYVTSMCTSPRGPLGGKNSKGEATPQNFKTLLHPAIFVVNLADRSQVQEEGRLLTQVLEPLYEVEAGEARMPLIPNDIAFGTAHTNGSRSAYVSALGADAIFRLDYGADGALLGIGSEGARYMDVGPVHGLPIGVAASKTSPVPFVLAQNDAMQRLSILDGASYRTDVETTPDNAEAAAIRDSDANQGHKFFATGLGPWSLKGQAWSSCESCHPGGLSDGVTWSFARGPRRTLSAANTYDKNPDIAAREPRLLLWGANVDEIHDVEGIVRSVSGGVGGMVWMYTGTPLLDCRLSYDGNDADLKGSGANKEPCPHPLPTSVLNNGLNGSLAKITIGSSCPSNSVSCDSSARKDWSRIEAFIRELRAPRAPSDLDAADVDQGRRIFARACAGCHGGPRWTVSRRFYEPGDEWNGVLSYYKPMAAPGMPPSSTKLGRLRLESYSVDAPLQRLNQPATATGSALLRNPPATDDAQAAIELAWDFAKQGNDQVRCALRSVGTYLTPDDPTVAPAGLLPPAAQPFQEVRQDAKTPAQGATGYNVPSLFGMAVGAPYFHAGNARTLEELLSVTFKEHYAALDEELFVDPILEQNQRRYLVAFLLSIEDGVSTEALPTETLAGIPVNYDFCPQ